MNDESRKQSGEVKAVSGRILLRWKKALFCAAVVATLIAIFYGEENWRGKRAWQRYAATMRADGLPVDFSDIIPPPVPDLDNFAATPFWTGVFQRGQTNAMEAAMHLALEQLDQAETMIRILRRGTGDETVAPAQWEKASLAAWAVALEKALVIGMDGSISSNEVAACLASGDAAPRILKAIQGHDQLLKEIEAASSRTRTRYPLDYDTPNPIMILLPHLRYIKALSRQWNLRAVAQAAAGRPDDAVHNIRLILRLGDSLDGEPTLISYLVRMACYRIAIGACQSAWDLGPPWPDEMLVAMQKEFSSRDVLNDLTAVMHAERAMGNGIFTWLRREGGAKGWSEIFDVPTNDSGLSLVSAFYLLIPNGWFYFEQLNYNRLFRLQSHNALSKTPPRLHASQVEHNYERIKAETQDLRYAVLWRHRFMSAMLLPALESGYRRAGECQTALDMAQLACALERSRNETGSYPATLDSLVPRYLDELPIDVTSTNTYRYLASVGGRYQLYSIGWDGVDDGGSKAKRSDKGDWLWFRP